MSCNDKRFRGDDFPKFLKINRPDNTADIDIKKCVVQIGDLEPFVKENPVFPYFISLYGVTTQTLNDITEIFVKIYWEMEIDGETKLIGRTLRDSLSFATHKQVVKDVTNE